jgi:hypothetical protein
MSAGAYHILAGASGQGGYYLSRSLRFRSSASAYLNRTLGSSGNLKAWSWSAWIKRGAIGVQQDLFGWVDLSGGNFQQVIGFNSDNTLDFQMYNSIIGGYVNRKNTTQVFRDPSAWYHIVCVYDSANATADDRLRIYINGTRVTNFSSSSNPSLNQDSYINNSSYPLGIGRCMPSSSNYFDGYMAEINFIDGQALTASSFGETSASTGVWQPKKYSGTYGTNGFYLPFSNNASTTTLGNDFSGNGNNWTTNNISLTSGSTYDSMTDVPTLTSATAANFAVINPLTGASSGAVVNGNLQVGFNANEGRKGTIAVRTGKWYFECSFTGGFFDSCFVGISPPTAANAFAEDASGYAYLSAGFKANSGSATSYGATFTSGDVIGVAYDLDAGSITFYKNGTSQGVAYTGLSGEFVPAISTNGTGSSTFILNFGQRPFAYTPPTGFVALNTFNLPTPTIGATASTQANKYFDISLYTGTGSAQTIINSGSMQPDWVWQKARSEVANHRLVDSVRGVDKVIYSSSTASEATTDGVVDSFNSNGFTGGGSDVVSSGLPAVAWQWKANGTGVSNTDGSITSTVSANTSAGFSIVTYTGTAANATVGHGLGVAPSMIICKSRGSAQSWQVGNSNVGWNRVLYLNLTNAQSGTSASYWNNTAPTSTVFSLGTDAGGNDTTTMVAYCFSEVAGYSKFGSYIGNGSSDGTFVYTGFRPRWIMAMSSSNGSDWVIYDTVRNTYNYSGSYLFANSSGAEGSYPNYDILSNGFKCRDTASLNSSGRTYIYMAFAENPFKYSLAR